MTPGPVRGLGEPCPTCGRPSGDHTLREWAACLGSVETLPYEETPADSVAAVNAAMRERFGLEDDWIVADNVVVRAATLDANTGIVGLKLPALIQEFSVGMPGGPPQTVAKVVFLSGDPGGMRAFGRLARDSANGAANRAERV